jgi:hypothetical protein
MSIKKIVVEYKTSIAGKNKVEIIFNDDYSIIGDFNLAKLFDDIAQKLNWEIKEIEMDNRRTIIYNLEDMYG